LEGTIVNEIAWITAAITAILGVAVAVYFYLAQKDGDK